MERTSGTKKTDRGGGNGGLFVSTEVRSAEKTDVRVKTAPTAFHAAYQPKAPVGVKAVKRRGKVKATMKLS